MLNLQPTFFDISFVFRRADKIALTLKKVAGEMASLDHIKDIEKVADIDKEVPADAIVRIMNSKVWEALPELEKREADLPVPLLDRLASRYSLEDILASCSGAMVPLKPREYTRIIVVHHGLPMSSFGDVLKGLLQAKPAPEPCGEFNPAILDLISPHLLNRSSYGPFVGHRMLKLASTEYAHALPLNVIPATYGPHPDHPPLREPMSPMAVGILLGAMYAAHRGMGNIAHIVNTVNSPKGAAIGTALALALAAMFGKSNAIVPSKTASFKDVAGKWVAPFVGAHFLSAHYRNKYERGEDLNSLQKIIAENPDYVSLAAPFAVHYGMKAIPGLAAKNKVASEESNFLSGTDPTSLALLSGIIWRGRGLSAASGLVDAGIDTAIMSTATRKVLENTKDAT